MKILFLTFSLLAAAPSFAREGGGSSVGPANPAAKLCEEIGGTLEPFTTPEGQGANCAIRQWTLFQALSNAHRLPPIGCRADVPCMPNPAAAACMKIGGELRHIEDEHGSDSACVIEEWALWRVFNARR